MARYAMRRSGDNGAFAEMVLAPWKMTLFHAAIIAAIGFWIYSPSIHGDWQWDDDTYITKNPLLNDPARLWKIWSQPGSFMEYYPIGQTVQWVQWELWRDDTFGYHLTNIVLHILDALLVWRLLAKLRIPLAWIGGLLFVAHPVNVESVAWIVELKNTLSAAPFLLALCAWVDFEEQRRPRDYLLALGLFVVAMLCKVSMITFPFLIPIYAGWKRGRVGLGDLAASVPFFAVSFVLAKIAMISGGAYGQSFQMGRDDLLPIGGLASQAALAGLAIAFYFTNSFVPVNLLPIYPVWKIDPPAPIQFLPWLALAAIIGVLWWKRKTWGRHALLGLAFFLVLLTPCLSFGVLFHPRDSWVMNHFLYLPIIGLIGVVTAAIGRVDEGLSRQHRTYLTGVVTLAVALLAFQAHAYASAYTNPETLWGYTLERNPGAWTAEFNLGSALLEDGQTGEAETHFESALRLKPDDSMASANLATILAQTGRAPEAIAELRRSLALNPRGATVLNNLGVLLAQTGDFAGAQHEFELATQVQPHYADPYNNLGNIGLQAGDLDRAEQMYRRALAAKPRYAEAHGNLGNVLAQKGRTDEAMAEFAEAIRLNPAYVAARLGLGAALEKAGRTSEALEQFGEVLQIDPNNPDARQQIARLQQPPPK